jgi:hypothetical protein
MLWKQYWLPCSVRCWDLDTCLYVCLSMKTSLHNATKPISFSTLHKVLTSSIHVMWAHATSEPTCYHADREEGSEPNNQECTREHKHALIHAHITAQLTAHKAKRTQTLALSCTHAFTHACTHACVRKQGTHPIMLASVHSVTHAPRHTRTHTHTHALTITCKQIRTHGNLSLINHCVDRVWLHVTNENLSSIRTRVERLECRTDRLGVRAKCNGCNVNGWSFSI